MRTVVTCILRQIECILIWIHHITCADDPHGKEVLMKKNTNTVFTEEKKNKQEMSPEELVRMKQIQDASSALRKEGYKQTSTVIGIDRANKLALTMMFPILACLTALFILIDPNDPIGFRNFKESLLFLVILVVLFAAREVVRALVWGLFTGKKFKDVEVGLLKNFTPFSTCRTPMKKGAYITGTIMPVILTGILPAVIGYWKGSYMLVLAGAVMIAAAAGDYLIIHSLHQHKADGRKQLVSDLPTQPGYMLFEK